MKISVALKNMFNIRIFLLLLGLEYVFQFTRIKRLSLPQVLMEFRNNIILGSNPYELASHLLPLMIQIATYLVLLICVFAGVLYLCKKLLNREEIHMGDFVYGLEHNWKKVFVTLFCFTLTFGLIKDILQSLIPNLPFFGDLELVYISSAISSSFSLFYNALFIYGSIILIEKEIKIRRLFSSTIKFIFSIKALKLYVAMLAAGCLLQPLYMLKSDYLMGSVSSALNGSSLGSLLDVISTNTAPLWLSCLEWLANTLIAVFTILYLSTIFYNKPEENDIPDLDDESRII